MSGLDCFSQYRELARMRDYGILNLAGRSPYPYWPTKEERTFLCMPAEWCTYCSTIGSTSLLKLIGLRVLAASNGELLSASSS